MTATSPTHDRGHASAQSVPEYPEQVRATRNHVRALFSLLTDTRRESRSTYLSTTCIRDHYLADLPPEVREEMSKDRMTDVVVEAVPDSFCW